MYRCEKTDNGIKGIFSVDEFNTILNGFLEMDGFVRSKSVMEKIDGLKHCFTEPVQGLEDIVEDVEVSLTYDEVGDLIALLTYFVPTKEVDVFSKLFKVEK